MLPPFLKKYFWDVSFEKIDFSKKRIFVLQRILEYGDEKAVAWMGKYFDAGDIRRVLAASRALSPGSANYWALISGMDRSKVRCLQKPYLEMRRRHWPY